MVPPIKLTCNVYKIIPRHLYDLKQNGDKRKAGDANLPNAMALRRPLGIMIVNSDLHRLQYLSVESNTKQHKMRQSYAKS